MLARIIRLVGLIMGLCFWAKVSTAATITTNRLTIEEIRLNGAPAFVVLGVTPSAVEQPSSPRAFATTVFSSLGGSDSGSTLPRNLAFEISPYWWFSGNKLTWEEYQTNDSLTKNLERTLTLSLASTEVELEETPDKKVTALGFGFRVNLLKGQPSIAAREAKKNLHDLLVKGAEELIPDTGPIPDVGEAFNKQYRDALSNYRQAILGRVGWQLEVAGGTSASFSKDDFGGGRLFSSGLWVTPAYRAESGPLADLTFAAVGRFLHHNRQPGDVSTGDIGARAIWTIPQKPYVLSAEYVQRFSDSRIGDSSRYSANVEYHFKNGLVAMVSLGRDFESLTTGKQNTFALFGFNVSLGQAAKTLEQ